MASTLTFAPQTYNLVLYAGDGAALRLVVTHAGGPVDLTGTVTAQIRSRRSQSDPAAVFDVDLSEHAQGVAALSLPGSETAKLGEFQGFWDAQWQAAGAEPVTLLQGGVRCGLDVTRP